jgi:ABC-type branched-subunit amino acid transport system permease subunit
VLVVAMWLFRSIMEPTAINTLAFGMTLAVVALSLVLLTGFAGEINLAAMSFGAIGAIIVYHFGRNGSGPTSYTDIFGYVLAAIVCAVVGAVVALPALRLRGLYLALSTMAFGVFVSHMVLREISERKLPIFGTRFTIFPSGNLVIPRPKFGPLDLRPMPTFLMFITVLFAALGVALIALRHSSYGRRLTAMKDSPAASATLGQNLVKLKLSVFMLSAAIAGLGGGLMAAQLGSVNLDRFDIFLSLSLLMLTVVGGIGYVSGGLMGGVLLGVAFVAIQNTFDKLGTDHASLDGLFSFFATATTVLPALMGISMGKNPSGAVHDIVLGFEPLKRVKKVMIPGLAVAAVAYLLAYEDVISNWWFTVVLILLIFTLSPIAKAVDPEAFGAEPKAAGEAEPPPELIGVDRPFTPSDREWLDRELHLPPKELVDGAARG